MRQFSRRSRAGPAVVFALCWLSAACTTIGSSEVGLEGDPPPIYGWAEVNEVLVPFSALYDTYSINMPVFNGIGLVSGLRDTGDWGKQVREETTLKTARILTMLGVVLTVGDIEELTCAAVSLRFHAPTELKPGQRVDIIIKLEGNATSIQGGKLASYRLRSVALPNVWIMILPDTDLADAKLTSITGVLVRPDSGYSKDDAVKSILHDEYILPKAGIVMSPRTRVTEVRSSISFRASWRSRPLFEHVILSLGREFRGLVDHDPLLETNWSVDARGPWTDRFSELRAELLRPDRVIVFDKDDPGLVLVDEDASIMLTTKNGPRIPVLATFRYVTKELNLGIEIRPLHATGVSRLGKGSASIIVADQVRVTLGYGSFEATTDVCENNLTDIIRVLQRRRFKWPGVFGMLRAMDQQGNFFQPGTFIYRKRSVETN